MHKHNFSNRELLEFGWSKTKDNFWYILQVILIAGIVYGASRYLGPISVLVSFCVGISVTTVALMIVHGHHPTLNDLFKKYNGYKVFLNYAIVSIISWVLIIVGFLLLIPGLYFMVKLQFAKLLVVDKDLSAMDAIKTSWKMTDGNFWSLFLYVLVVIGINLIGAIPLGIGLFVTVPVTMLASVELYKKFSADL